MPIILGIDGSSGDIVLEKSVMGINIMNGGRDKRYDMDFAMSFVSRICKPESQNKKYLRGPSMLGEGLVPTINEGLRFITNRLKAGVNEPILLTGYSRGAAGVVVIAKRLKELRVRVKAMLLFDCVGMHALVDAKEVPSNVEILNHVMRYPSTDSRNSFGNDGTLFAGNVVNYTPKLYFCTHGGMGGVPWQPDPGQSRSDYINEAGESFLLTENGRTNVTFDEDEKNSKKIWTDLKPFMSKHGFYTGA